LDLPCFRVTLEASRQGDIRIVSDNDKLQKRREFRAFLFLTIVLAPLLSGLIVGGYGFAVWMFQLIAGPPGS
jgi:nitrate reductase NapE